MAAMAVTAAIAAVTIRAAVRRSINIHNSSIRPIPAVAAVTTTCRPTATVQIWLALSVNPVRDVHSIRITEIRTLHSAPLPPDHRPPEGQWPVPLHRPSNSSWDASRSVHNQRHRLSTFHSTSDSAGVWRLRFGHRRPIRHESRRRIVARGLSRLLRMPRPTSPFLLHPIRKNLLPPRLR